ncbi:acyltransferase family protein [Caulobacter sp. UNC279MFTsu5.1]|uniref:acyltransferase family protein n=1 Tax=Caulobacter sp. UNC279MFTsu5.1 TaxID=1502775 RepID=UPI0008E9D8D0|nr:acyltransferase family protein [Caulobacter sp. UNC279MFTsu5.1]SFJ40253.1 Peptidoglycan/LPS O-acetylase OafA/YrhL, contains acyltransferase and SGNH-hydrolase domains [Caulobacter sp. UNC279MFTsu5.1]
MTDPTGPPRTTGVRADIQALRALAVLLVVVDHARLVYLPGGFLGVDIFFVISGYLMMRIIEGEIDAGRFSFRSFYARRVRRLLPAAYSTLAVTAAAAPFLLDVFENAKFVQQLVGAFTFTTNMILWRQIDYFDSGAALKPLLHMWSLAIEEQYYLALPLLAVLCPRRFRLPAVLLLTIASAALCLYAVQRSPSAAFYFLPTRAWELGAGSAAALIARRGVTLERISRWARPACALVLLVTPFIATERGHPGLAAIVVCLATAVLLVSGQTVRPAGPLAPLIPIGDRSYSLYLVHWPLFAFANNVFVGPVPWSVNALLLAASFGLAALQYSLVEQPLRRFKVDARAIAVLVAIPTVAVAASVLWARHTPHPNLPDREWNVGLDERCVFKDDFQRDPACQSAPHARTLVWGDSFGMHLAGGLAETSPGGVAQATRTVCGPFLDIAPINGALYRRPWAESCLRFNRQVLDDLARRPEIDTVVLSSALTQYVRGAEDGDWRVLARTPDGLVDLPQDDARLLTGLARTVDALRRQGKRVVLVAPPPSASYNIGRCVDRLHAGLWSVLPTADCAIDRGEYWRRRAPVLKFLAEVERRKIVPVIGFDQVLCDADRCQVETAGRALYLDNDHFSQSGSRVVARRMNLGDQVRKQAR